MAEFRMLGVSEFKAAIEASVARQLAATREAVSKGAHAIEGHAKELLTEASHPKGTLTPSPPGNPPALVSGTLRRSVTVKGPVPEGKGFSASIGPTAVYGRIQELGGIAGHGSNLPARPYMAPAVTETGPELEALFREAWSKW